MGNGASNTTQSPSDRRTKENVVETSQGTNGTGAGSVKGDSSKASEGDSSKASNITPSTSDGRAGENVETKPSQGGNAVAVGSTKDDNLKGPDSTSSLSKERSRENVVEASNSGSDKAAVEDIKAEDSKASDNILSPNKESVTDTETSQRGPDIAVTEPSKGNNSKASDIPPSLDKENVIEIKTAQGDNTVAVKQNMVGNSEPDVKIDESNAKQEKGLDVSHEQEATTSLDHHLDENAEPPETTDQITANVISPSTEEANPDIISKSSSNKSDESSENIVEASVAKSVEEDQTSQKLTRVNDDDGKERITENNKDSYTESNVHDSTFNENAKDNKNNTTEETNKADGVKETETNNVIKPDQLEDQDTAVANENNVGESKSKEEQDNYNEKLDEQSNNDNDVKKEDPVKQLSLTEAKDQVNFTQFPTPRLLRNAQDEFNGLNIEPTQSKYDIPLPFPPPNRKDDVFNLADYAHLDSIAASTPKYLIGREMEELIAYITQDCQCERDAVRTIFRWIVAQDVTKLKDKPPPADSPMEILLDVKHGEQDFADLFNKLCRIVEVPCAKVHGYVKGKDYTSGNEITDKLHATWSAVLIDGVWRFVDAQMASCHLAGKDNDVLESTKKPKSPLKRDNSSNSQPQYNEFFFFADPEEFIYSHLPDDPIWQLLARPVSRKEFEEMAYIKPAFFDLGMTIRSHPRCILYANDGEITIKLGMNENLKRKFMYRLSILKDGNYSGDFGEYKLDRFVFMQCLDMILKCNISFPEAGEYKLDIYGKDCDSVIDEDFKPLCTYVIHNEEPSKNCDPLPVNHRIEWGPGMDTDSLGLKAISHETGIIQVKDGEIEIKFSYEDELNFVHELTCNDQAPVDLQRYVVHQSYDGIVTFYIRLPNAGMYGLNIFGKLANKKGSVPSICTYLLSCESPNRHNYPFPSGISCGRIGPAADFKLSGLLAKTTNPIIHVPHIGETNVSFGLSKPMDVVTELTFHANNDASESLNQYVFNERTEDNIAIDAILPYKGQYHLSVYAREANSSGGFPRVYSYIIQANIPKLNVHPFPKCLPGWSTSCELLEPRAGLLSSKESVHFAVKVPNTADVAIINALNEWTHMTKGEDGVWRGDVTTGERGTILKLTSCTDIEAKQYTGLLVYQIKTEADVEKMNVKTDEDMKNCPSEQQEHLELAVFLQKKEEDKKLERLRELKDASGYKGMIPNTTSTASADHKEKPEDSNRTSTKDSSRHSDAQSKGTKRSRRSKHSKSSERRKRDSSKQKKGSRESNESEQESNDKDKAQPDPTRDQNEDVILQDEFINDNIENANMISVIEDEADNESDSQTMNITSNNTDGIVLKGDTIDAESGENRIQEGVSVVENSNEKTGDIAKTSNLDNPENLHECSNESENEKSNSDHAKPSEQIPTLNEDEDTNIVKEDASEKDNLQKSEDNEVDGEPKRPEHEEKKVDVDDSLFIPDDNGSATLDSQIGPVQENETSRVNDEKSSEHDIKKVKEVKLPVNNTGEGDIEEEELGKQKVKEWLEDQHLHPMTNNDSDVSAKSDHEKKMPTYSESGIATKSELTNQVATQRPRSSLRKVSIDERGSVAATERSQKHVAFSEKLDQISQMQDDEEKSKQLDELADMLAEEVKRDHESIVTDEDYLLGIYDYTDMRRMVARDRLVFALKTGDVEKMAKALNDFKFLKCKDNEGLIRKASEKINVVLLKEELVDALHKRDRIGLTKALKRVNKYRPPELTLEVMHARRLLEHLGSIERARKAVMNMDAATISEIRRYSKPSPVTHSVMASLLLVLGDHEGKTRSWKKCQKILSNVGADGLSLRVGNMDVDELHPEIAMKVRVNLKEIDLRDVQNASAGVVPYFIWMREMVDECLIRYKKGGGNKSTLIPADRLRQKEIFGELSDEERRNLYPEEQLMSMGSSPRRRPGTCRLPSHTDVNPLTINAYNPAKRPDDICAHTEFRREYNKRLKTAPVRRKNQSVDTSSGSKSQPQDSQEISKDVPSDGENKS